MQFRVPQFIDIEDKILGPLTWRQTAYVLGAVGVAYIFFRFIDSKLLALILSAPFVAIFLAFAFVKINNRTFVEILENAFRYYTGINLYTWRQLKKEEGNDLPIVQKSNQNNLIPKENKKSLKDIALGLDTKVENR
ncbi:MAG: hypothetical protein QG614_51 [Patescibacteria group bacterium]|nr:hypothetical protein [Patescibacteria group bacterium]